MNSTRRQFVTATLVAMPAMSYAGALQRDQKPAASNDDPVWAQIQEELKRLDEEVRRKKPTAQTLRALESTFRFHAAHAASKGRDQAVAQAVKRHIREKGRASFLADAIDLHRQHERHERPRVDSFNRALPARPEPSGNQLSVVADRLGRGNYPALLRESADAARTIADGMPAEAAQPVRLVSMTGSMVDYCGDAHAILEGLTSLKDLMCVLALIQPELFAIECAALQTELWILETAVWWFCTVI